MTLENKLHEKIEDLKLAKSTISQLERDNEILHKKTDELARKNRSDSEEMKKMIDFYERELQSQKRLVQLHKVSSEENTKQVEKLTSTIHELQNLLYENANEQSEAEIVFKSKEQEFSADAQAKESIIENLKEEVAILTHSFKSSSFEKSKQKSNSSSPSGLSLTEIYRAYVKVTEQLHHEKEENEKLQLQLKTIFCELEERAPIIQKQNIEYQTLVDANNKLSKQIESVLSDYNITKTQLESVHAKLSFYERENSKLMKERGDLGRQVCHLLKEIEQLRGGPLSEEGFSVSFDMSADEVITKRLVTFSNVKELQENNTKLLLLVRDLSSKLEEMEESQQVSDSSKLEEKMNSYIQKIEELQSSQEKQTQMIKSCIDQRDRYKDLYLDLKDSKLEDLVANGPNIFSKKAGEETVSSIAEKIKQLEDVTKEFEQYQKETQKNLLLATEEKDTLRSELRDLTAQNYKLASSIEFKTEQLKSCEKTSDMRKKQIETLEIRNRNYETIISKHELTIR